MFPHVFSILLIDACLTIPGPWREVRRLPLGKPASPSSMEDFQRLSEARSMIRRFETSDVRDRREAGSGLSQPCLQDLSCLDMRRCFTAGQRIRCYETRTRPRKRDPNEGTLHDCRKDAGTSATMQVP